MTGHGRPEYPLISRIDIDQPEERVHGVFELIMGVWNASVMATPDLQGRLQCLRLPSEAAQMHRLDGAAREHSARDRRAVGT